MTTDSEQPLSFWAELRLILKRAVQVWRLVPRRQKLALCSSAVLMAVTSACATAIALLLGRLVESVHIGVEQGLNRSQLIDIAGVSLSLLAGTYLLRESLHVLRRLFAENACTAI